jgi:hypothetical protein
MLPAALDANQETNAESNGKALEKVEEGGVMHCRDGRLGWCRRATSGPQEARIAKA